MPRGISKPYLVVERGRCRFSPIRLVFKNRSVYSRIRRLVPPRSPFGDMRMKWFLVASPALLLVLHTAIPDGRSMPPPAETRVPIARTPPPIQPAHPTQADQAEQASLVEGNSAFAFDLYAQLRGRSGNLFFSPY